MKIIMPTLLLMILAGCGPSELPQETNIPTVEELASDPARLKDLRQQCKTDRPKMGDVLCNRVTEATRRRFMAMARRHIHRRRIRRRCIDYLIVGNFFASPEFFCPTRCNALSLAAFLLGFL